MKSYKALPKTAEEITGLPNCTCFSGVDMLYTIAMNDRAKKGEKIIIFSLPYKKDLWKDDLGYYWERGWLKDIREVGKTYTIGDSVYTYGHNEALKIYQIANSFCCLFEEGSYNRWRNPVKVDQATKISIDEVKKMLGSRILREEF